ncbi:hypothetical protein ACU6QF_00130, partial [Aeromonas veronii]|uniref:hypothetical protein n=1 Tax=Aeromonas veronii TaxID=654 RepID=UPI00406D40BE
KDRKNPFDGLSFSEKKKRKRPPFPLAWIIEKVLAVGALSGLNDEARAILFVIIESGARLGEVANLGPDTIMLSSNVPHIKIE